MVGHTPDESVIIMWVLLATHKRSYDINSVEPSKSLMSNLDLAFGNAPVSPIR